MFFVFSNLGQSFRCRLECKRCEGKTKGGEGPQCKRRVCVGLPMCWSHARQGGVKVKQSGGGRGKGLFAFASKRRGEFLTERRSIEEKEKFASSHFRERCIGFRGE